MNVEPKSRAELQAIRRTQAREHAVDQFKRGLSALNAAIDGEPSSTRCEALCDIRRRVLSVIAEIRLLG